MTAPDNAEVQSATTSLEEYLRTQQDLVKEASLALPHSFSQCSHSLGYIRQPVYLCQTCPEAKGICASCSIACHADHEQIELFPKRHFRCDCPTTSLAHPCTLHKRPELENTENTYGQNFNGLFCRCHRTYDAATEKEAMIQCLACEDWFHESCCNLRERPPPRGSTPPPEAQAEQSTQPGAQIRSLDDSVQTSEAARASTDTGATTAVAINEDADTDARTDTSDDELPPALISSDDYETFVCGACVQRIPVLKRYAGSSEAVMVGRGACGWVKLDGEEGDVDVVGRGDEKEVNEDMVGAAAEADVTAGMKRPQEDPTAPDAKRRRVSEQPESHASEQPQITGPCQAPTRGPAAERVLDAVARGDHSLGTGDVFLTRENFRERWCRCGQCLPSLEMNKFLLEEEETWEPPEDEDSGLSLEELGLRALNKVPRDQAIDGITHYNKLRDHLVNYLRPFAQEGKVVAETDVRSFFADLVEARAKATL